MSTSEEQTSIYFDTNASILGTWLRDLARKLPNHNLDLHGVDIGSTLFPPSTPGIEPLVDLREHDIRTPFPPSWNWKSTFDVIHQRLLIWGIKSVEWPLVIKNLVEGLKPGGYIQLVEAEWISIENPADQTTRPQLWKQARMQEWSTASFGMDINVAYKLENWLKEAGLEDVTTVQFDHGYGALAKAENQKNPSAELWVECFRTLDEKIPGKSGKA